MHMASILVLYWFRWHSSKWLWNSSTTRSIWLVRVPSKPISHSNGCYMHILSIKKVAYRSEMPSKVNFGHPIWPIDQKWPKMRSKVIFGHPKWPPKKNNKIMYRSEMVIIGIESEFRKSKMANRSDMARNTIGSEFRTSKMTESSHFVKNFKKKLCLIWKWPELAQLLCEHYPYYRSI